MESITTQVVRESIYAFLDGQCSSKVAPEKKKLAKAEANQEIQKVSEFQEKIAKIREKYQLNVWMEQAVNRMAQGLKFGTHISKGVHSESKGDNIVFRSKRQSIPAGLVASQHLDNPELDTNGNAAYLPLAAFFDCIVDEEQDLRIRHLIVDNHPALKGVFASDPELSDRYLQVFQRCLSAETDHPKTSTKNKQIFWPRQSNMERTSYTCLVPLYPSSLTHEVHRKVNAIRFSEENKAARDNRYKDRGEQQSYQTFSDLAAVQLGGSNSQNVGRLVNRRGGRDYLLPSVPPIFRQEAGFRIGVNQESFFHNGLKYHCAKELSGLFAVIKIRQNNVRIRVTRKAVLDSLLDTILMLAASIQVNTPAGWSKSLRRLSYDERLWLDPGRAQLEGEEEFAEDRVTCDWQHEIEIRFANWVNMLLKKHLKKMKYDFGEAEQQEWRRELRDMMKQSQRRGLGVFL